MTHGDIKGTNVPLYQYHNVPIQDNDVVGYNDRNDMFRKALIDVYLLGVSNPKGCVHSQPQIHFYLKQHKELLCFSFYLFIFTYFILIRAMSESVLKRLRRDAREKEVERKAKAFRREQIEKERT